MIMLNIVIVSMQNCHETHNPTPPILLAIVTYLGIRKTNSNCNAVAQQTEKNIFVYVYIDIKQANTGRIFIWALQSLSQT